MELHILHVRKTKNYICDLGKILKEFSTDTLIQQNQHSNKNEINNLIMLLIQLLSFLFWKIDKPFADTSVCVIKHLNCLNSSMFS